MIWSPGQTLENVEQVVIQEAYRFYRNNKTQTAESLGIAIRTLDNKLEIYEQRKRDDDRRYEQLKAEREIFLARSKGLPSPSTGPRMESAVKVTTESKVSLPERAQVQEVLSGPIAKSSVKRGR